MFGKSKISKSMIDAVNSVIGEEPVVETKKQPTTMLSEEIVDFNIDPHTGKMIETPDLLVSGYERKLQGKQVVMIEEEPDMKSKPKKKMLTDDELDETGFHMAAHAARKSGAKQFEFQGKKYPVTAKSHTEEYELDEEGNCVTPMKAKNIAKKEVKGHEKEMHKESMTFKERLLEKSVSTKQARTMAAAAHNPKFAKKVGIPQDVAKDFNQADKGTKQLSNAMKKEEIELDEKDELRGRIGTNIVNKKPREGQTDLRNIPVGNRPDSKKKFSQGERDSQPSRLKNDIKASLGKHTKPNLPEEMEVTESLKDVAKKILSKVGHPDDKEMRKDLQKKVGVPQTGEKPMKKEEVESVDENAFTDYKTDKKPSIFAPKKHTAKKTEKGTMYTKNWSKKDMEHKDDDKVKKEETEQVTEKLNLKKKTVDMLGGRVKVSADYDPATHGDKPHKVELNSEETHSDEKEDKALIRKEVPKIVKDKALKKSKKKDKVDGDDKLQEAFKGPEAGSGTGDHPFITAEAKPLKNARELAKTAMNRIKNEMLGKISN